MVHLMEERTYMDLFIWGGGDAGGGRDVGFTEALLRKNNLWYVIVPLIRIHIMCYYGFIAPYLCCCIG